MVLHGGSTSFQTVNSNTRSTPDQGCVFQKYYSGCKSHWDSCILMDDSLAPCFRALTNFASALGSCCDSAQAGRVSLCSFLTEKQHLLLRLTGWARKISQPSRQNAVKPLKVQKDVQLFCKPTHSLSVIKSLYTSLLWCSLLKDRQYHSNWRCVPWELFLSSITPLGGQSYPCYVLTNFLQTGFDVNG